MTRPLQFLKMVLQRFNQPEQRIILAVPVFLFALWLGLPDSLNRGSLGLHSEVLAEASLGVQASPSVTAGAEPVVVTTVSGAQARQLQSEFTQVLLSESRALDHQMASEMKALVSSQKAREREWKAREKKARREFFEASKSGAEKTHWMDDRRKRFNEFKKDLQGELARVKKEQALRRTASNLDQKTRQQKFTDALKQGQHPESALWHPSRQEPLMEDAVPSPSLVPSDSRLK